MAKPRATHPSHSPEFGNVAGIIGDAATMALCERFGGVRLYIPRHISPTNPIAQAVGIDAANRLAEYLHGTNIDLPKAYLGRRRVIEMKGQGFNARQIALATGYTDRHVRHILADAREDDGQMTFPGMF
jgi:hypothetical protein